MQRIESAFTDTELDLAIPAPTWPMAAATNVRPLAPRISFDDAQARERCRARINAQREAARDHADTAQRVRHTAELKGAQAAAEKHGYRTGYTDGVQWGLFCGTLFGGLACTLFLMTYTALGAHFGWMP